MDRDTTTKRFVMECFEDPNPPDIDAEGDACEFFDTLPQAQERAAKLLNAGRFKCLALWMADGDYWQRHDTFRSEPSTDGR